MNIIFLLMTLIFYSHSSHAILDARLNFGGAFIDPRDFNSYLTTQNVKETYIMGEIGADALLELPITGLSVGVRYMYAGLKLDGSVQPASRADMEWHIERYMAVGRYQTSLASGLSFGPILAVGIFHKPQMRIKNSSSVVSQYDTANSTSINIGLETSTKIAIFKIAAEGGYQYYTINNLTGPNGVATLPNINLSGMYAIGHVGVNF